MATIRVSEWGRIPTPQLSDHQRERLAVLAAEWKSARRLPAAPLAFEGARGTTLVTRQYVGVIEAEGVAIEIYPKLDRRLREQGRVEDEQAASVLKHLLWMLEVSGYEELVETGEGGLAEEPDAFVDLFALLMARRLRDELGLGVPRRYERFEDDLKMVRGRLLIDEQATRNFDRWDRVACAFDEFTPDTPVCRILRCACRELSARVRHPEALRLISDCLGLLDEVSDLSVIEALRSVDTLPPWSRALERFRRPFGLAVRLLQGLSHELLAGSADTFVFLLDMNRVFEAHAAAALRAKFGVPVETQKDLGRLLPGLPSGGIHQKADFFWKTKDGAIWIADAKYKHLAAGQDGALTFAADETAPAGRLLSPDDVRQLTVYAELVRRETKQEPAPFLALIYPFVGGGAFAADSATAWNGSPFWLFPLKVTRNGEMAALLPSF